MIVTDKLMLSRALNYFENNMTLCVRKKIGFPTRSNTNQPVQSQKTARSLKLRLKEEEGLYNPCSENKGADQLHSYCTCRLLVYSSGDSYLTLSFNVRPQAYQTFDFESSLGFCCYDSSGTL